MKAFFVVVVFVALAGWMFVAGTKATGDEGKFSIVTDTQFNEVFEKAREATEQAVFDFDSGTPLSAEKITKLKVGKELLHKVIAYRPTDFGPYMMLAKTLRALGETELAVRNYQQALLLIPRDTTDPSIIWLIAEIKYDLASYHFEKGEYGNAEFLGDEAAIQNPGNAKYAAGAAQTKFVLNKMNEARKFVDQALKAAKNDPLAIEVDKNLKELGF